MTRTWRSIEGSWSLVKRGAFGTFHKVKLLAVWLTPFLIVAALVIGAMSLRVPVPTEEQKQCFETAQKSGDKNPSCSVDESLWQRGLGDPVAYYTLWLVLFTGVLAGVGILQGYFISQQISLANKEFAAIHRPRLVVRDVYWDAEKPGSVAFILVNQGVNDAKIVECRYGFNRSDKRPILSEGDNVLDDMTLEGGGFGPISVALGSGYPTSLAAFESGLFEDVSFQGLMIYTDGVGGPKYRMVFKRICAKGQSAFVRTGSPDDEYSD